MDPDLGDPDARQRLRADAERAVRYQSHPLMWPLWPVLRFGPVVVWAAGMVTLFGLQRAGFTSAAWAATAAWGSYGLYAWIVPPLLRRFG